jgi:ferredoxin--NADP+ reductase
MSNIEKTAIAYPEVQLNLVRPKAPVEVPVVENVMATAEGTPNFIRHVTFDVSGTPLEGNIVAGQSIGIIPDGTDENGKPHKVRLYSVSSPSRGEDGHGKLISTTVKRVVDQHWDTMELFTGICSNFLGSRKPGMTVKMTGPSGKRFILPENPQDFNYIFFATGTGIAPFRGMLMDLIEKNITNQVALIFGCPYRTDILYKSFFESMDKAMPNFHYLRSISREDTRSDGSKRYVQYALIDNRELLEPIIRKENTLIYVCGLKGMETGIFQILANQGYTDYFKAGDELSAKPLSEWSWEDVKTLKPTDRMNLEVY